MTGTVTYLHIQNAALRKLHTAFFERARTLETASRLAREQGDEYHAAIHQRAGDIWDRAARDVRLMMMEDK